MRIYAMNVRRPHSPRHTADRNGHHPGHIEWTDVCAHLFKVCGSCRKAFLDARGITCIFDVDSGALASWTCNILEQIVLTLIMEICCGSPPTARRGQITVSLRHAGDTWILAVMDEGVRHFNDGRTINRTSSVEELASLLNGSCRIRLTADGAITAVLFKATARALGATPFAGQINLISTIDRFA